MGIIVVNTANITVLVKGVVATGPAPGSYVTCLSNVKAPRWSAWTGRHWPPVSKGCEINPPVSIS